VSTTTVWTLIAALAVATIALKALGPLMTGGRTLPPAMAAVIALMPSALLAALVVTSTLTDDDGNLTAGADAVGVLLGGAAVWRTGKVLHAVVVAIVVTAGLRALS
jgi:branched-subunit amino acid transport protein